jgi:hypothetical protein
MTRSLWIERAVPHIMRRIEETDDSTAVYDLGELQQIAGGEREPDTYRTRSYWMAEQRGENAHCGFRRAGLVLSFSPDARGQAVSTVTFRRDAFHPPA